MALRKGMKGDQGIVEWSSEILVEAQVSLALHPPSPRVPIPICCQVPHLWWAPCGGVVGQGFCIGLSSMNGGWQDVSSPTHSSRTQLCFS